MGDYSLYCNVSHIAIRPGVECVMIPLVKNKHGVHYPKTLPIYGTYTGYGSLELIEQTANTKAIEQYFDKDIESFCEDIMRYCYDQGDTDITEYMLIDRHVYDKFANIDYSGTYNVPLGYEKILKFIGMYHIDTDKCGHWKYGQHTFDTTVSHSLMSPQGSHFYENAELCELLDLPEDKRAVLLMPKCKAWRYYTDNHDMMDNMFGSLFDLSNYYFESHYHDLTAEHGSPNTKHIDRFETQYLANLDEYGDELAKLRLMTINLTIISKCIEPNVDLMTPQYGNYKAHNEILKMFLEVNGWHYEQWEENYEY